jgi:nitrogen fixation NifU-like protein
MALDDLYQEILLDHYKNPRNQGKMDNADVQISAKNPFCGDEVVLNLKLEKNRIKDISFEGQGCVISQASVSLLTEYVKGKTLKEIGNIVETFQDILKGEQNGTDDEDFDEMNAFRGVSEFPTRVKCATLAWNTLVKALEDREKKVTE